ncbi:MAG: hypothetical protein QNJ67_03585 [Kiloniellales bacterium]|nr:hypothetical protein [Kiloniellales bacterium]
MTAELVLNELSLDPAPAVEPARDWMLALIHTCHLAQSAGASRMLLLPENAVEQELSDGYSLWHWTHDPQVDIDLRRKFLAMATYGPFTERVLGAEAEERLGISEYFHAEREAKGLSAAHVLDGLAVSIPSGEDWNQQTLEVKVLSLDEAADLVEGEARIRHACAPDHVAGHRDWLGARQRAELESGADLWEQRRELFPGLDFCARVEDQLRGIERGDPHLRQVLRRLCQVNDCFVAWRDGPFERGAIPDCDPESQVTLQRFEAQHSFRCPDGETRVFSWHVPITPGPWRLFFYPEGKTRKGIVGHIGPKLPNVSYTT